MACHEAYLVTEVNMLGCIEFGIGLQREAELNGLSGFHLLTLYWDLDFAAWNPQVATLYAFSDSNSWYYSKIVLIDINTKDLDSGTVDQNRLGDNLGDNIYICIDSL